MNSAESAAAETQAATLDLREASFRWAGSTTDPPISLRSVGRSVGLIGEWEPLFFALTGAATLAKGSARILGCEIDGALARGIVGFAPADPPLPALFSVREYVEHTARLSHGSRARAADDAGHTLEEFGLTELAPHKLGQLAVFQARALGIAVAALGAPPVLCLEAPLRGLDAASADYIARLCAHAAERSRIVISSARPSTPSAERALLDACDELFLLEHGSIVAHGAPEAVFRPSLRYLLTLVGPKSDELVTILGNAGCKLSQQASPTTFSAVLAVGARVTRYSVELHEPSNPDLLLDVALDAGVTVLELEPLYG